MSAPARRRRVREPDPVRLPLPGQDPAREAQLLARLSGQFKPVGPVEEMWVEDVAWCSANIEYIRAMIAAHRKRCIESAAYRRRTAAPALEMDGAEGGASQLSIPDEAFLDLLQGQDYSPVAGVSYLANPTFAGLLGDFGEKEQQQMRELQAMLHEEHRERDRIIRQIHRTRQQDMADAVAVLEAQGWVYPDRALSIEPTLYADGEDEAVITVEEGEG